MKTKGTVTSEQIHAYNREAGGFLNISKDINKELSLKSMLISCFTYGGIARNSWNFEKYISPYQKSMSKELFEEIYSEMNEHFNNCEILHNTYIDHEGCNYNTLIEK